MDIPFAKERFVEDPDFNMQRDLILMTETEEWFRDYEIVPDRKANVLILSYNRPRMLGEAIASVLSQEYPNMDVYVVDDGSDFDVWGLIESFEDSRLLLAQAPRIPIEERMSVSRLGSNLNSVLSELEKGEVVFYLCDDDILAPKWVWRAMTGFSRYDAHVVAGESWYFEDGRDWRTESKYGLKTYESIGIPTAYWSTGNFAHLVECFKDEGLRWKDNHYLHSQDANFIMDLWNLHTDYLYIPMPAVYRREHPNMMSSKLGRKDDEGRYKVGYIPPPASREHIESPME